jgi:hypothetical protein
MTGEPLKEYQWFSKRSKYPNGKFVYINEKDNITPKRYYVNLEKN